MYVGLYLQVLIILCDATAAAAALCVPATLNARAAVREAVSGNTRTVRKHDITGKWDKGLQDGGEARWVLCLAIPHWIKWVEWEEVALRNVPADTWADQSRRLPGAATLAIDLNML